MLDFGWPELFLIMALAVLVVGPKEIPQIMYTLGRVMRRLQYMRFALTSQFDEFMRESEIKELRNAAGTEDFIEEDEVEEEKALVEEEKKAHDTHVS